MIETAIVAAILGVLATFAVVPWVAFETVLSIGGALVVGGFAFGLPVALVYHVRLYRALAGRNALPTGWYWNPIPLNRELTPHERRHIVPWCWAGGAGFTMIVLGIFVVAAKAASMLLGGN